MQQFAADLLGKLQRLREAGHQILQSLQGSRAEKPALQPVRVKTAEAERKSRLNSIRHSRTSI